MWENAAVCLITKGKTSFGVWFLGLKVKGFGKIGADSVPMIALQ